MANLVDWDTVHTVYEAYLTVFISVFPILVGLGIVGLWVLVYQTAKRED